MLTVLRSEKGIPHRWSLVHGVLASTGLFSLTMVSLEAPGAGMAASLILFVAAVAGGAVVFALSALRKTVPGALVSAHAVTAVIAYSLLLASLNS
jgi:hypothetical protein